MTMLLGSHGSTGIRQVFFIGVIVVASACADRAADEQPTEDLASESPASEPTSEPISEPASGAQFASSLDVDLARMTETPTGLYVEDIEEGSGEAVQAGQEVTVHYTGWLPDGEEFDSSRDGEPFTFQLGAGGVIPGWDEGVAGMMPGGRRKLVIPPDLAYGAAGRPPVIPPNATLVFDVELIEAR